MSQLDGGAPPGLVLAMQATPEMRADGGRITEVRYDTRAVRRAIVNADGAQTLKALTTFSIVLCLNAVPPTYCAIHRKKVC